jgi:hypothetical protein
MARMVLDGIQRTNPASSGYVLYMILMMSTRGDTHVACTHGTGTGTVANVHYSVGGGAGESRNRMVRPPPAAEICAPALLRRSAYYRRVRGRCEITGSVAIGWPSSAHHTFAAQVLDLGRSEPELAEHLVRVRAERRGGPLDRAGRAAEA